MGDQKKFQTFNWPLGSCLKFLDVMRLQLGSTGCQFEDFYFIFKETFNKHSQSSWLNSQTGLNVTHTISNRKRGQVSHQIIIKSLSNNTAYYFLSSFFRKIGFEI